MEAVAENFKGIMLREHKFKIPFFQRLYIWKKEDWERLFKDLDTSFKNKTGHFLGSIILKRSLGNDNFVSVIDGQQRLTTFSILVKCLYDKLDEENKRHFEELLFETYTNDYSPKIKHSYYDREKYEKLMKNDIDNRAKDGIFGCYNYFMPEIEKNYKEASDKFNFVKYIVDTKVWVIVRLDADEDEQKIFDSINSTGEPLSATDIIKNALFDKAIKESNEKTAIKYYEQYWRDIFEKSENKENGLPERWWDKKNTKGRTRSEILLHAIAIIKGFFNVDKHRVEEISMLYKEYINNLNITELENLLQEISKYAKIYKDFPKTDETTTFLYEEWELRFFHAINTFEFSSSIIPLILYLKDKLQTNKEELQKCIYLLEILILYNDSTRDYNKFFANLIAKIKENKTDSISDIIRRNILDKGEYRKYLNIENIKNWFNNISNFYATFVLFWIELYRQYQEKSYKDTIGLQYVYTLEHLMPQKWEDHWSKIGVDKEKAESLIYQIGNMTLVKGKLNSALRNRPWRQKLNGDGKARNYIKKNADLLITKELFDKKEWNETEITNRTKRFLDDFLKIWNLEIFK